MRFRITVKEEVKSLMRRKTNNSNLKDVLTLPNNTNSSNHTGSHTTSSPSSSASKTSHHHRRTPSPRARKLSTQQTGFFSIVCPSTGLQSPTSRPSVGLDTSSPLSKRLDISPSANTSRTKGSDQHSASRHGDLRCHSGPSSQTSPFLHMPASSSIFAKHMIPVESPEELRSDLALIVDPDFLPPPRSTREESTVESESVSYTRMGAMGNAGWRYVSPPMNQRTFFFPEDNIEFSSEFDSGNLIQMERSGPFRYNMYTAMDCANTPEQTNNRQWFHFSVRGGQKGALVSMNVIGVMHSKMFTFDWMPVMALRPQRPQYQRLPGKAVVVSLDTMPSTPGYPLMVHKKREDLDNSLEFNLDGDDDGDAVTVGSSCYSLPPLGTGKPTRKRRKKDIAMSLAFDFRIEAEFPLKSGFPLGHPNCPAIYIASNHPYSYDTLQRNIATWEIQAQRKPMTTSSLPSMPATQCAPIYFHREVLCKTLDNRNVDLLTITDRNGMQADRLPMMCTQYGIPYSAAHGSVERPPRFAGKLYAVLTARVHPGECPASHMMHGCIEFLLSRTDPRAAALRQKFVFMIVPMINPDGVARGHSRADSCGVDLNRMYRNPCPMRHPAPYCIRMLLNTLAEEKKLALFIDMHAHANKKGTFFYGNSMSSSHQLQALLYSKLVQLNTPYFEFSNCNFTESNMFATGKAGKGKDNSSRVVVYLDTGFPLSFTIEASHVAGKSFSPISSIPGFTDDTQDTQPVNANVRYSPLTFADTGRGLLLALLDLKGYNPISRIPQTMFHSVRGVTLWLQRQLQVEVAERLFVQAYKSGIKVDLTDPATVVNNVMSTLSEKDVPEKMTIRNARSLPPLTLNGIKEFFSLDSATVILAQTPPSGPPRSLLCGVAQRRVGTSMPVVASQKSLFADYQAGSAPSHS